MTSNYAQNTVGRGMKGKLFVLILVTALWPISANELSGRPPSVGTTSPTPERLESTALTRSLAHLERRYRSYNQGVLVETLDGSKILAESNADVTFNPASVMKLATSFVALAYFGPDHRFHTTVYGDSQLDTKKHTLAGNLYVISDGNPLFNKKDASALSRCLVGRGLRRVEGDLVVVGPFCLDQRFTAQKSAEQLHRSLGRSGIRIKGKIRLEPAVSAFNVDSKVLYLSHASDRLRDILWEQNAYSVNETADRLGDLLGGPLAVQQFLVEAAGIEPHELYVGRPSGLDYNRMTARAAVKMLRELSYWLEEQQLKMQDIMPVAGLDEGTLYGRFRDPDFRGGVLGKTGTNSSKDGGISALAGVAYTRAHGPVLYAIFNTRGSVRAYRRWQDRFLKGIIEECGGLGEYLPPHEGLAVLSSWTPSEYWGSLAQEPERRLAIKRTRASSSRKYVRSRRGVSRRRI